MAIFVLRVVSPVDISASLGCFKESQEGQLSGSSRSVGKVLSPSNDWRLQRKRHIWSSCALNSNSKYACVRFEPEENDNFPILSSLAANLAGEVAICSEWKVRDVVLKQATLVRKQLRSDTALDLKPDMAIPGATTLLNEAYARCGEVCAAYAKNYYLGTLLMTPEIRRAIWAISGNGSK